MHFTEKLSRRERQILEETKAMLLFFIVASMPVLGAAKPVPRGCP